MESAANRLQKEAKGYLDSLRGRQAPGSTGLSAVDLLTSKSSHDSVTDANR